MGIRMHDLTLVTSCHRSSSWANSVRYDKSSNLHVGVKASFDGLANINLTFSRTDHASSGPVHNKGPVYRRDATATQTSLVDESSSYRLLADQCLFVKGYTLSPVYTTLQKFVPWNKTPRLNMTGGADIQNAVLFSGGSGGQGTTFSGLSREDGSSSRIGESGGGVQHLAGEITDLDYTIGNEDLDDMALSPQILVCIVCAQTYSYS
jgi:hypothetical protein